MRKKTFGSIMKTFTKAKADLEVLIDKNAQANEKLQQKMDDILSEMAENSVECLKASNAIDKLKDLIGEAPQEPTVTTE